MSDTLPERPTFISGQYIGADDLNAAVDYARDETRRLALSARTWGIGSGLALVEVPDASGNVQMFIEPGIAWDGYGRPVVVLSPAPVTPDLFASLPSGNQMVWLRYTAAGTQAVAPGFQTCGAGDPTTRVLESYAIETGTQIVQQLTGGVIIGGATVTDPRDMLIAVDTNASVTLDGSVAYQTFPDDTGVWLIPIGIAAYNAGAPGSFSPRSGMQLAYSRTVRRYMGVAAESLLAADGVLRLRDRETDNPTGATDTQLDQAAAIQSTDIGVDPNNSTRLIGNELVWVEGNMRITGNARMFGTQLELRDPSGNNGAQNVAPEFLRSASPASNPLGGQDLQICIGSSVTGTPPNDRLTIGVLTEAVNAISSTSPDGPLNELVVVRTDGRVAIGTNAIDSYSTLANNLVVASAADTGITVVSAPGNTGNLYFADGTSKDQQKDGYVAYDHSKSELELGAGANTVLAVTPGSVVVGDVDPADFGGDADQLIVASSSEGAGITISGKKDTIDSIDFANGTTTFDAGFIRYNLKTNEMSFGTDATEQVWIDSAGRVGIGTALPTGPVQVASRSDPHSLVLDLAAIQAFNNTTAAPLQLQPQGSTVGIGTATPSSLLQVHASGANAGLIVDSDAGTTSLRAGAGTVAIGAAGPARTTLDVQSAIENVSASVTPAAHLAIFENAAPTGANVLALMVGASETADTNCRFVTFFDGNGTDIGAIVGSGDSNAFQTVTYSTYGADYAEAVPRLPGVASIGSKKIVGVRAGQVSLATDGADAVFVTSESPAMLARRPHRDKEEAYETLAFLGQVRVLVAGPVRSGDLIVASGKADGMGRAVSLEEVQPEDLAMTVGRAWESADDGSNGVNALVGPGIVTAAAAGVLLARQAREIERLSAQLARRKTPSAG
jgi:hypothetical protein